MMMFVQISSMELDFAFGTYVLSEYKAFEIKMT